MPAISLSSARARLLEAGVCGPHRSHSRANAVGNIRRALAGDEDFTFGLSGLGEHSPEEVLSFMAELTGCSPDLDDADGLNVIEPEKTLEGIIAAARRLHDEARRGSTILAATGHPTGLLEHHIRVLDAYREAGGKMLLLREEERFAFGGGRSEVRYTGGVGCLCDGASLKHTHSSKAMEALLAEGEQPDIVLADHGFAGAAIERGIPAIAVMDINDPALSVPWKQGKDVVIVPLDDNRAGRLYEPSWLLFRALIRGEEPAA